MCLQGSLIWGLGRGLLNNPAGCISGKHRFLKSQRGLQTHCYYYDWSVASVIYTRFGIPFSSFWIYSILAIFSLVSSNFKRWVLSELNSSMVARLVSSSLKYLSWLRSRLR